MTLASDEGLSVTNNAVSVTLGVDLGNGSVNNDYSFDFTA